MLPQIGPKEAPIMENTPTRLSATPVTARIISRYTNQHHPILFAFGNMCTDAISCNKGTKAGPAKTSKAAKQQKH